MATFKIVVSDYKRADGKYQVRIRVIHKQKTGYIKTPYLVNTSDVNKKGDIISTSLLLELKSRISSYEQKVVKLSHLLDTMPIHQLIEYLNTVQLDSVNLIDYLFESKGGMKVVNMAN